MSHRTEPSDTPAKISYQGEPGANSHLAAREAYPDLEPVAYPTFEDAILAVKAGEARYAIEFGRDVEPEHQRSAAQQRTHSGPFIACRASRSLLRRNAGLLDHRGPAVEVGPDAIEELLLRYQLGLGTDGGERFLERRLGDHLGQCLL